MSGNNNGCRNGFSLLGIASFFLLVWWISHSVGLTTRGRSMAGVVPSAGSPLDYFNISSKDAMEVTWAHAVNTLQKLDDTLKGVDMMLEADSLLEGQGTVNQTSTPIMAHPPNIYSDLTLADWMKAVVKIDRGIKLDFKSDEVIVPAMQLLAPLKDSIKQPVWINADILKGPNSQSSGRSGEILKKAVTDYFPHCTLSVGWTSSNGEQGYTAAMVEEMLNFLADAPQSVTFPIRASLVGISIDNLKKLLAAKPTYTLTIWSNAADATRTNPEDLLKLRKETDFSKIYYDLPEELMKVFQEKVDATSGTGQMRPWISLAVAVLCVLTALIL